MAKGIRWTRDQLLVALKTYCSTTFGKLHSRSPEIVRIANLIDRSPDALAMKTCNFASLDPVQQARSIRGLQRRSKADEHLWEEFKQDAESVAAEAEAVFEHFTELVEPEGPTEVGQVIRARRVQHFFRQAVLVCYDNRCALTGISATELLTASHIIPWSVDEKRRADPHNGLCLNALHDRAFDRGLITFDENIKTVVSSRLKTESSSSFHVKFFLEIEWRKLQLPVRFQPDDVALEYHRMNIFQRA